jgi:hypothetical protein
MMTENSHQTTHLFQAQVWHRHEFLSPSKLPLEEFH